MSFSSRVRALAALVGVGALLAGCGATVIDSSKVEEAIKANLEKALHTKVSGVSCPSEQKVEAGAKFTCTVSFAGGRGATATLKILNKEGNVSMINLRANK
jgi:Domain of unknown function (DUF4333)